MTESLRVEVCDTPTGASDLALRLKLEQELLLALLATMLLHLQVASLLRVDAMHCALDSEVVVLNRLPIVLS